MFPGHHQSKSSPSSFIAYCPEGEVIVYRINPLYDPRWIELLQSHLRSSIFQTPGWLGALRLTYGYQPVAYTTCLPDANLRSAWVFCRVNSWLTGRRLVSLPFSDHCDPLLSDAEEWEYLAQGLEAERDKGYAYIEWRPRDSLLTIPAGFRPSQTLCFHRLDLRPGLQQLFNNFHKDSVQRKIRRAEREGLTCTEGRSEDLLSRFYDLHLSTRLRHRLPPQPRRWFRNLIQCMGEQLNIGVASYNGTPVASILTLRFKNTLVYKYGCSDARFFNLGGIQLLLWRAIENAKENGAEELDLGRSDLNDEGLIVFKDRWGAERSQLTYFRSPMQTSHNVFDGQNWSTAATRITSHIPNCVVSTAGKLLYRHFG